MTSTKKKKKSSTKKKSNLKNNFNINSNVLKICFICLLVLVLSILVINLCLKNNKSFEIDSRVDSIKEAAKEDTNGYKTYAWLRIPGTNIDHRIIKHDNLNEQYPVNADKYGWSGQEDLKFHNKMNIFGHNILNLGPNPRMHDEKFNRFEDLMSFIYYDFAKDNQFIQFSIDGKDYAYQIFAVTFMNPYDVSQFSLGETSEEEMKDYIDYVSKYSLYDYDIEVNSKDKVISVIVCTRTLGEDIKNNFVVSAKLIDNDDYSLVKVSKTKKYEEIKNIMKGSE